MNTLLLSTTSTGEEREHEHLFSKTSIVGGKIESKNIVLINDLQRRRKRERKNMNKILSKTSIVGGRYQEHSIVQRPEVEAEFYFEV